MACGTNKRLVESACTHTPCILHALLIIMLFCWVYLFLLDVKYNMLFDFLYLYFNDVGRVLNRFSKDIGFMDTVLPYKLVDCITVSSVMFTMLTACHNLILLVWITCCWCCCDCLCGQLLVIHPCHRYICSTTSISTLFLVYFKKYTTTRGNR